MRISHALRSAVGRWLVAAVVGWLSLSVQARQTGATDDLIWNIYGNTATGSSGTGGYTGTRSYGTSGGNATMTKTKPLPWPGKSQAENMASWKMKATPRNMASSIVRPGAGMLVPIVVGGVFKYLMDQACVRLAGGTMQLADGGQWEECHMVTNTVTVWEVYGADTRATTKQAACNLFGKKFGGPTGYGVVTDDYGPQKGCRAYTASGQYVNLASIFPYGTAQETTQQGWDPSSETAVETKVTDKLATECNSGTVKCSDALRELIESGVRVEMYEPATVTGPATVAGAPTTTTKQVASPTTGQPTVQTTTTTNTYNYSYADNKVTQNITTVVSVTYADGSPGKTETETETDERSYCERNPDAFDCRDIEAPEGEIPKSTANVTFSAEAPFGGGSCPADKVFTSVTAKRSFKAWDWAQTCSYTATYVRPVVLLLATFAAFLIVMPGKVET